jgi:hypothetical protein
MTPTHCLRSIGRLVGLCSCLTTPALALVLVAESRSVTASYYGNGIETISSPGTFGKFSAAAVGIPFGGGSVWAGQTSDITTAGFTLAHSAVDNYGPGGVAESLFQVTFSLPQATQILITGVSNYFSGNATLVSDSLGMIPLLWGPPGSIYRNNLDFDQVLAPGVYTFTSREWIRDSVGTSFNTRISLIERVPDGGGGAWLLGLGIFLLAAIRRKLA